MRYTIIIYVRPKADEQPSQSAARNQTKKTNEETKNKNRDAQKKRPSASYLRLNFKNFWDTTGTLPYSMLFHFYSAPLCKRCTSYGNSVCLSVCPSVTRRYCVKTWSPSNTKLPVPSPSSISSGILIHAAIWPQQIWAENWGIRPPPWGRGRWVPI